MSSVKTAIDLYDKELVVGAAGAASPSAVFPNVFNAVLGTKFKVINGYPSSANSLLAMEAGEVTGFCAWGWVAMRATRPEWIRDKKFNVLFQIGLRKHPDHPEAAPGPRSCQDARGPAGPGNGGGAADLRPTFCSSARDSSGAHRGAAQRFR